LTSIVFPASLTNIGERAFKYNHSLTSVIFSGNAINSIGGFNPFSVFEQCENLTEIKFSDSSAGSVSGRPWGALSAFVYWSCGHIDMPDRLIADGGNWVFNPNNGHITGYVGPTGGDLVIPDSLLYSINGIIHEFSIHTIQGYLRNGVNEPITTGSFNKITISPGITLIGHNAFLDATIGMIDMGASGVKRIEYKAFMNCGATNVVFPETLTQIDINAFADNNLIEVNFPNSLTTIRWNAFANNNLTSLTLPEGLTTLNGGAFMNNNLQGHIIIPGHVNIIGGPETVGSIYASTDRTGSFAGNPGITFFTVMQYRNPGNCDGVYDIQNGKYFASTSQLREAMSWGTTLSATDNIRYMDDPGPRFTYELIPNPETNTVTIQLNVVMSNNVILHSLSSGEGMPELFDVSLGRPGNVPSTAKMTVTDTNNGNDAYRFTVTFLTSGVGEFNVPVSNFKYNVKYDGNTNTEGTAPIDGTTYIQDVVITLPGQGDLKRVSSSLVGYDYKFYGWTTVVEPAPLYTQDQYNSSDILNGLYKFEPGSEYDVMLYAVWGVADLKPDTPDNNTVIFDPGPGTFPNKEPGETITEEVLHGDPIGDKMPENPTRPGYDFDGWEDDDGNPVDENTIVEDDMVVTAVWIPILYEVTFDANGGMFDNDPIITIKTDIVKPGDNATAPTNPTRPGYIFIGWDKDFENITAPMTVYAQWVREVTVNDVFDDDDEITGTGEPGSEIIVTIPRDDDDDIKIPTVVDPDGNWTVDIPPDVTLEPGDEILVEINDPDTGETWDEDDTIVIERPRYTVIFVDWDGTLLSTQYIKHGGSASAPGSPTRPGHMFAGWSPDFTNVTSDLIIVAQYTAMQPPDEPPPTDPPTEPPPTEPPPIEPPPTEPPPTEPPVTEPPPTEPPPTEPPPTEPPPTEPPPTEPPPVVPPIVPPPVSPPVLPPAPPPGPPPPPFMPLPPLTESPEESDDLEAAPEPPAFSPAAPPVPLPPPPPAPPASDTPDVPEPTTRFDELDVPAADYMNGDTLELLMEADVPTITIGAQDIPLFAGPGFRDLVWALWNLILSIAGFVLAVMMGIRMLLQKRKDKKDKEQAESYYENEYENEGEKRNERRNRLLFILAVPILAIIAIVLFLLTQDMNQLMVMVDLWTITHVILFVGGLVGYIFAFKKQTDEENDDEDYEEVKKSTKSNVFNITK